MPGDLLDGWRQQCLSESGIEALVRPVGKRRLLRCAGSARTSNVAFRGITPDLTTAIQAVAKSGVDAGRIGAVARRTDRFLGMPTRRLPEGATATHPGSTTDAALGACSSARFLRCGPAFDLGTEPKLHAARAEVEHGLRHVDVPPLILGDCVAVSEPKDFGNALGVKQILGVHLGAIGSKPTSLGGSVRPLRVVLTM